MVINLISEIRAIRSEMNIPLSSRPDLLIRGATKSQLDVIESMRTSLVKLARINDFSRIKKEFPADTAVSNLHGFDIGLPLTGILDFKVEAARLNKEISLSQAEVEKLSKKLSNAGIPTGIHYPVPIHKHECFADYSFTQGKCFPVAEDQASQLLSLPMHPNLNEAEVEKFVKQLKLTSESEFISENFKDWNS